MCDLGVNESHTNLQRYHHEKHRQASCVGVNESTAKGLKAAAGSIPPARTHR